MSTASDVGGSGGAPWVAGIFVRSGANGEFEVNIPIDWGAEADGALDVVALAPDFAPYLAVLAPGMSTLDATLTPAVWQPYTITALTPDGRPAIRAVARAVVGMGDSVVFQVAADGAGRLRFRAPTTGPVPVVAVSTPGYRAVETQPFRYGDTTRARITVTLLPVITGIVRDERSHPLAGIGVFWNLVGGLNQTVGAWKTWIAAPNDGTATDTEGRYTIAPPIRVDPEGKRLDVQSVWGGRQLHVMFADSAFTELAFTQIDPAPPGATAIVTDVTLHPTREVRVPIVEPRWTTLVGPGGGGRSFMVAIEPAPAAHTWEYDTTSAWPIGIARVDFPDSGSASASAVLREAVFRVPPGRYRTVAGRWPDVNANGCWFDVPPGTTAFTMVARQVSILPIDARIGRPAPEFQTTDLDGRPVHLADYRGKVIVLDFWGYWCGACVQALQTRLIPFAKEYAGKPVVVLAVHDASVRSRLEYDSVFARLKSTVFGGRDLPFPVLLDRPTADQQAIALGERTEGNGMTVAAYNVSGFPSTFVIDARGNLAGRVDVAADSVGFRHKVNHLLGQMAGSGP